MRTKKNLLLQISITGGLYLFLKDKKFDEKLKAFKKSCDTKFYKIIMDIVTSHDDFKAVLDKKTIYQNSVETICSCFTDTVFSESALFDKIKNPLQNCTEQEKIKFLELIVLFAYTDNVITESEKETLAQFLSYLGFSEETLASITTKIKPKKKIGLKLIGTLIFLGSIVGSIYFLSIEMPGQTKSVIEQTGPLEQITQTSKRGHQIMSCSRLLEERKDSAKEFESGMAFARGVNEWKITKELQDDDGLSYNERKIPQENFELFKAFLRSPEYPKNLFNWILGVLSVKPDSKYLPYLAVFQKGCMNYLRSITGGKNPLVDYFEGRNTDLYTQADSICNDPSTLLSCGGLQAMSDTKYLVDKKKFKQVNCLESTLVFEGDMDANDGYKRTNYNTKESNDLIWIYNSEILESMKPKNLFLFINEMEWGGLNYKYFETDFSNFFPAHSIGSTIYMGKDRDLDEKYMPGYNFETLYELRDSDAKGKEYQAMANFVYQMILSDYETKRPEPYFLEDSSEIHLLGLVKSEGESSLFFAHLGTTYMENGSVNIRIEEGELTWLYPGGFLIYAYDIVNRKFGVILNLSQPIFQGGYITSNGLFMPLD
jgi:hypothetical protein